MMGWFKLCHLSLREIALITLAIVTLQASTFQLSAQTPAGIDTETLIQLQSLRLKVKAVEHSLERIEQQRDELQQTLEVQTRQLKQEQANEKQLTEKLDASYRQELDLNQALSQFSEQRASLQARSFERIRSVYMNPPASLFSLLLTGSQTGGTGESTFYMSIIRQHDTNLIAELVETERELERVKTQLLARQQETAAILAEQQVARSRTAEAVRKQRELVQALAEKAAQEEEALFKLQAQAIRIESIISGLTSGESLFAEQALAQTVLPDQQPPVPSPAVASGLKRGQVLKPVTGEVARPFGKRRINELREIVFQKGVEIAVQGEVDVVAIADGVVSFVGELPALDTVVVIDHGDRAYSVYGKLNKTAVVAGAPVRSGEPIGRVGDEQHSETLYFEIRKAGKAVDPQKFY